MALDAAGSRLYLAVRAQPGLLVLDALTGQQLASAVLAGSPGEVQLDSALGWLYVVLPDDDAIATIDIRNQQVVRETPGLRHVSGIALDRTSHLLYVTQLEGYLSILDGQDGIIRDTVQLSDVGLAGVAVADGRVYAINTPGRELIAFDPVTLTAHETLLSIEPAAIAASPLSGTLLVLAADNTTLARLSPEDGSDLGDVPLSPTAEDQPVTPLEVDSLWRRPRLAVGRTDESVYLIEPDAGTLALVKFLSS